MTFWLKFVVGLKFLQTRAKSGGIVFSVLSAKHCAAEDFRLPKHCAGKVA